MPCVHHTCVSRESLAPPLAIFAFGGVAKAEVYLLGFSTAA